MLYSCFEGPQAVLQLTVKGGCERKKKAVVIHTPNTQVNCNVPSISSSQSRFQIKADLDLDGHCQDHVLM